MTRRPTSQSTRPSAVPARTSHTSARRTFSDTARFLERLPVASGWSPSPPRIVSLQSQVALAEPRQRERAAVLRHAHAAEAFLEMVDGQERRILPVVHPAEVVGPYAALAKPDDVAPVQET